MSSPPLSSTPLFLFGGTKSWLSPTPWTALDDRVRGGSSRSHLTPIPGSNRVSFSGTLDTTTLGGAGFASQTTAPSEDRLWDLSGYDGLEVDVVRGDGKVYTLIVKDEEPEGEREDGREKAGVSWEYDFKGEGEGGKVKVGWGEFRATYRGREKKDAGELKIGRIRRFSLMMRSFFDKQEGDFKVELSSISAFKKDKSEKVEVVAERREDSRQYEKTEASIIETTGWLSWLPGSCIVS